MTSVIEGDGIRLRLCFRVMLGFASLVALGSGCARSAQTSASSSDFTAAGVTQVSGGPSSFLVAKTRQALVHLRVWVAGQEVPLPGTAFVVSREGDECVLLTAWHVLHPAEGAQVVRLALNGAGIAVDTEEPAGLVIGGSRESDIAILKVQGNPVGPVLRVGVLETAVASMGKAVAMGFAEVADRGTLPEVVYKPGLLSSRKDVAGRVWTTNADLLPGMSGGPVVLPNGLVIGVVSAAELTTGEGLVSPLSKVSEDLEHRARIVLQRRRAPAGFPPIPRPWVTRLEEAELAAVLGDQHSGPSSLRILLTGGAGTGKTALASKVVLDAYLGGKRYSDGIFFIEVKDRTEQEVLEEIARVVGLGSLAAQAADIRAALFDRDTAFVLDDIRAETLPGVLSVLAESTVILTSRRHYRSSLLDRVIEIGSLPQPKARELLLLTLKANGYARLSVEEADRVCGLLGNNALAVSLAAGAIAADRLRYDEFVALLNRSLLDPLESDQNNAHRTQRAAISVSWQLIGGEARSALVSLSAGANSVFDSDLAAAIVGQGALGSLRELTRVHLLSVSAEGIKQYRIHPLVHAWVAELGEPWAADMRAQARVRMYRYLLGVDLDQRNLAALVQGFLPHVTIAVAYALEHHEEGVYDLLERWDERLRSTPWEARRQLWDQIVERLQSPSTDEERLRYARALMSSGTTYLFKENKIAEERYVRAEALFRALGDELGQARVAHNLGVIAWARQEYAKATDLYNQARVVFFRLGARRQMNVSDITLSGIAVRQGMYVEATRLTQQVLERATEAGDHDLILTCYETLGVVAEKQRDYDEARRQFQRGMDFALAIDSVQYVAQFNLQFGVVAQEEGNYPEAIKYYKRYLAWGDQEDSPAARARAHHQLGIVAHFQAKYKEAEQHYLLAHRIKTLLKSDTVAYTKRQLGKLYLDMGTPQKALPYIVEGLLMTYRFSGSYVSMSVDDLRIAKKVLGTGFVPELEKLVGPEVAAALVKAAEAGP